MDDNDEYVSDPLDDSDAAINQFLKGGRGLIMCLMKRLRLQRDCCVLMSDEADRQKLLPQLVILNKDIERRCAELRAFERLHGNGGITSILGKLNADRDALYIATLLLFYSRLSEDVDSECRRISSIIKLSCMDAFEALGVRDSFRTNGCLFQHVKLSDSYVIDNCTVELSESSFNRVLNRPNTTHEEYILTKQKMEMPACKVKSVPF